MPYYANGRVPSASPYHRDALDFWHSRGANMRPQIERIERDHRMPNLVKRIAGTAVGTMLGVNGIGALTGTGMGFGPAANTSSAAGIPGYVPGWEGNSNLLFPSLHTGLPTKASTTAGHALRAAGKVTGGGGTSAPAALSTASRLGSMFNSAGMNLGVNAGMSLLGMRAQNKAAEQARQDTLAANREAIALQRAELEERARNADLDRQERKELNDAINALKKRELDAAEEERAFSRGLIEAREARLAPYRHRRAQLTDRMAAMLRL